VDRAIRSDDHPGEGGMLQGKAQPGFRRELKCSACKVSDNISMTDNDLIAVLLLLRFCTVEILPEGSFYPGTILLIIIVWFPRPNLRLRCNGSPFSEDAVSRPDRHLGQGLGDQVGCLYGPGHVRVDHEAVGQGQLGQSNSCHFSLISAQVCQVSLTVSGSCQVVLSMPNQNNMSGGSGELGLFIQVIVGVCHWFPMVPILVPFWVQWVVRQRGFRFYKMKISLIEFLKVIKRYLKGSKTKQNVKKEG